MKTDTTVFDLIEKKSTNGSSKESNSSRRRIS